MPFAAVDAAPTFKSGGWLVALMDYRILVSVLLFAFLSGCMAEPAEDQLPARDTTEAGGTSGNSAPGGGSVGSIETDGGVPSREPGEDPPLMVDESGFMPEPPELFVQAFAALDEPTSGPSRVAIHMDMTFDMEGSERSVDFADMLFDREQQLMVMRMWNPANLAGLGGGSDGASMIMAQVYKTTMMGSADELMVIYDEDAEPPTGFGDEEDETDTDDEDGSAQSTGPPDPAELLEALNDGGPVRVLREERIMFEGRPAVLHEMELERDGVGMIVESIVWVSPPLPAQVQMTMTSDEESQEFEDPMGAALITMTFRYDGEATSEHEEAALRMETLAFTSGDAEARMEEGFFGGMPSMQEEEANRSAEREHEIQPSLGSGSVSLDEVELWLSHMEEAEARLVLPAELGSVGSASVRMSFIDADGDGAVSTGDRISLRALNDEVDLNHYQLRVHDEVSGWSATPNLGLLALLGALAGAAGIASLRRSRLC